jgi:hypothetical protein
MAECDVPFIDCTNKDITLEELLKLMAVKLPSGDAALRTCGCGCGGGGESAAMPIGNFLFVNPLGDDLTGERENFHKPFKTLNAAKLAAAPMSVTLASHVFGTGTGYPAGPQTNVATSGGSGVGLTVDYEVIGFFTTVTLNNIGSGYLNGEIVTVNGGNNDMQVTLQVTDAIDTIYVYGGIYNESNTLYKDNVKWNFVGNPTVNLSAAIVFEVPVNGILDVVGDADFNHIGIGKFVRVIDEFSNAKIFFKSRNVTSQGQHAFIMHSGTGIINIAEKLEVNLINRCIQLGGTANYVFNINDIYCSASIGQNQCINLQNQLPIYTGDSIVNCTTMRSDNGNVIEASYGALTGKLVVNVSGKIVYGGGGSEHQNSCVASFSADITVNGDLDGGNGHAIDMTTIYNAKKVTHKGNAYNDGALPLIDHGDPSGFWSNGLCTLSLNGKYRSSNEKVIQNGGNNPLTHPVKMTINGEIYSDYIGANPTYGIFMQGKGEKTMLDNVKIVTANAGAFGIGASLPANIKIVHNVASNANVDGNITNLITGTNYVFDTDIE